MGGLQRWERKSRSQATILALSEVLRLMLWRFTFLFFLAAFFPGTKSKLSPLQPSFASLPMAPLLSPFVEGRCGKSPLPHLVPLCPFHVLPKPADCTVAGPTVGWERIGHGDSRPVASTMKCSLRVWFLSMAFLLVFIMSLLFTYSHHSMATLPYLDSGTLGGTHRVKLVPGYTGQQRLVKEGLSGKSCTCSRCMGDAGTSEWFDSHFDSNISPVWTRDNMNLTPDVQRWWMMLQPQFKSHNTNEVLEKLFQIVPGENPYRFRDPQQCRRCAVVGNSGNLRGSGYGQEVDSHNFIMRMNQAPTVGFEKDVGSRTTHHFMYPESAKNLPANVSFVLVPFKALDLMWIASALSTGQIRFTYAPVKSFLRVDKEKVQIYNPAFFKYIHDRWTEHHGRYPSTGMLVLFFALHVCDEVNVYGFGADSRGNWHHYWENNRYAGEFRKTGVHDADFEAHIIDMLAKASKIEVYRGN